jgi:hypothetical protein
MNWVYSIVRSFAVFVALGLMQTGSSILDITDQNTNNQHLNNKTKYKKLKSHKAKKNNMKKNTNKDEKNKTAHKSYVQDIKKSLKNIQREINIKNGIIEIYELEDKIKKSKISSLNEGMDEWELIPSSEFMLNTVINLYSIEQKLKNVKYIYEKEKLDEWHIVIDVDKRNHVNNVLASMKKNRPSVSISELLYNNILPPINNLI